MVRRLSVEAWQTIIDDLNRLESDWERAVQALLQAGVIKEEDTLQEDWQPWHEATNCHYWRDKQHKPVSGA